jgi:hypothetical protein
MPDAAYRFLPREIGKDASSELQPGQHQPLN